MHTQTCPTHYVTNKHSGGEKKKKLNYTQFTVVTIQKGNPVLVICQTFFYGNSATFDSIKMKGKMEQSNHLPTHAHKTQTYWPSQANNKLI